ncbi:hypothetical protein SESBI_40532 [Sesbania bispinosa]|nr:hypothetical protein SESBI_40532 [Sesbania bispinosa]
MKFRRSMLGDYDVGRFRTKWDELINEFDLHGNQWVKELYEKRKMWATAHIRGNFFAGFRTTSRCEGIHAQVGRFVHYRNNLTEFLKHFTRYLAYTRQRELEADFETIIGEPVLLTPLEDIERTILERASGVRVVGWKNIESLDLSKQVVRDLLHTLRTNFVHTNNDGCNDNEDGEDVGVRDPARVRSKGCGPRPMAKTGTGNRRTTCCSICEGPGHNKKTCPNRIVQEG